MDSHLILWRHAEASIGIKDINRDLTEKGKLDGKEISGFKSKTTLRGILLSQLLIFISMSIVGSWWYYFAFWLVPALTTVSYTHLTLPTKA